MNRLYLVAFLIAGVVAVPAAADGYGNHRKGGERLVEAIKQMDANDDGSISFEEFRMPEGRDSPDMRIDANKDGQISREEVSKVLSHRTEVALARFDNMDADGDSVITLSELRRFTFDRIDGDGDGQITESEFREAHDERRRMMREQGGQRGYKKGDRKGMQKRHTESD